MIDFFIVLVYFIVIFITALSGAKLSKGITSDEYFLSGRSLKWPSIAISTIATNVQGYQFLGMMGSAYLFGLAQANLEINAMQGLLIAAFIFVPVFLKHRITTITQFIKLKLGSRIALCYSIVSIVIFSTITLGAALFWGAYATEMVFGDVLSFIGSNQINRISILIIILGVFSAIYTYLGGLSAVVKTDIIQFFVLIFGGILILVISLHQIGGWNQLFILTPEKMHLHLSADHDKLPWTHVFGLFFLNINYWCANQTIMQRSIAAKNLKHAQAGLMIGGVLKYFMAVIIILPGIALYSILDQPLTDPDMAFPYLVKNYIPVGLRGLILCGLFASLMSTVDSTFNSIATMWSVDIYSVYINNKATDFEKVQSGRRAIIFSLFTALIMGLILLFLKFESPGSAFTHTLNEIRYYLNCGIVVLICSSILLIKPKYNYILISFVITLPSNIVIQLLFPEINYFVRAFFVIIISLFIVILFNKNKIINLSNLVISESNSMKTYGIILALSLVIIHIIFH